jgi:hypothetical protein
VDDQVPHPEDEIYVVTSGRTSLLVDGLRTGGRGVRTSSIASRDQPHGAIPTAPQEQHA